MPDLPGDLPPSLYGIPIHESDVVPDGTAYLVDLSPMTVSFETEFARDPGVQYSQPFVLSARLAWSDTTRRPDTRRERWREAWRLYKLSLRNERLALRRRDGFFWREAKRMRRQAVCMIVGHRLVYDNKYARCRRCRASRELPTTVLKMTF